MAVRKKVKHLHVDFCFYEQQYQAARALWLSSIAGLKFDDGTPLRLIDLSDTANCAPILVPTCGNPLLCLLDETSGRELNISQHPPMHSHLEMQTYIDTSERGAPALYINCALSEESLDIAARFVRHWLIERVDAEKIESIVEDEIGWLYE